MPVKVSPTDTNRELRGHQIGTRAKRSTANRAVHITLGLSLARCPFCSGTAQLMEDVSDHFAECENCLASGPSGKDHSEAARRWNSRMVLKRRSHGT
jgi:hypothetical protein